MKLRVCRSALLSLLLLPCAAAAGAAQQKADEPLTNASVVKLVRAGFREKTVISIIGRRPSRFDLSADALIELKKGGVSERIIVAMISRQNLEFFSDSEPDDDDAAFFGGGRPAGEPSRRQGDPGELDIFGSSGGSKGRVKSNGGSGGLDSDTQTTGSVTARIIRPPTEPGGAGAPKLERTPTLTNESVIQLVEAGFTDGTIVRRIEQSPVEFDLSPEKLTELRRRRVSESVIAAMKAAMQGETGEEGRPRR